MKQLCDGREKSVVSFWFVGNN